VIDGLCELVIDLSSTAHASDILEQCLKNTWQVSTNRAIFMVQDGSVSYEVKNFLLKQKEVESVTIDQQHWDADGDGTPTFPGSFTHDLMLFVQNRVQRFFSISAGWMNNDNLYGKRIFSVNQTIQGL
jgi:uncharacterized membrane protein YheB (UPF0754 family)